MVMKRQNTNSKNSIKIPRKRILRAMELWALYGAGYATAIDTYRALLQRKRDLKIRPLSVIPEGILREYPDIHFLKIREESKAQAYLGRLDTLGVEKVIHAIEYMVEYDYAYHIVTNRVREYEYQIKHHGQKKTGYGVDPDSVGRKGLRNRSSGRNVRVNETK